MFNICTAGLKCSTGEIRLESKRTNATCGFITGKVEICENGTWKTICDPNWTVNDVKVACRELGYIDQGEILDQAVSIMHVMCCMIIKFCVGL